MTDETAGLKALHHTRFFYERLGVAMLLSLNSSLAKTYSKPGSIDDKGNPSQELKTEIDALFLNPAVESDLLQLLQMHKASAFSGEFLKPASRFTNMYSGDPCPDYLASLNIMKALRTLDVLFPHHDDAINKTGTE